MNKEERGVVKTLARNKRAKIDEICYGKMAEEAIRLGKFPDLLIATLSGNNFTAKTTAEQKRALAAFKKSWKNYMKGGNKSC